MGFSVIQFSESHHAPISNTSKLTGLANGPQWNPFLLTLVSPFDAVWDSRDGVTHIPGGNSLLSNFSPTQPEIRFHGDSKSFQVDNGD